MNAITRVATQGNFAGNRAINLLPLPELRVFVFLLVIFVTALSVVYIKDLNRRLFIAYQTGQQATSQTNTDYEKLLLERSTWSQPARVQMIAEQRLAMEAPAAANIVMVKV
ncbi:MAG: cell division protein FtsL [Gammaproteobacteria bacterium]|nr:cell division protein FtsL [Gammaproteobacteria bacterium]